MEPVKFSIAASIALYKTIEKILIDNEGKERKYPANIKYKLQRSRSILEKDYQYFEKVREDLIKKYGEESEGSIKVKDENLDSFRNDLIEFAKTEVHHSFSQLTPEEMNLITTDDISMEEMDLFIASMIDDPELTKELSEESREETNKTTEESK